MGWVVDGWCWWCTLDYNVSSCPFLSFEIEIGDGPGPELDNFSDLIWFLNGFIIDALLAWIKIHKLWLEGQLENPGTDWGSQLVTIQLLITKWSNWSTNKEQVWADQPDERHVNVKTFRKVFDEDILCILPQIFINTLIANCKGKIYSTTGWKLFLHRYAINKSDSMKELCLSQKL